LELFVRNIRLDAQLHADILIALSDVRGEVEKTAEVEITLESGVHLLDSDATGGRVVDHRSGYARRQSVEQMFDGIGALVGSEQNIWLVGRQPKASLMLNLLSSGRKRLHL